MAHKKIYIVDDEDESPPLAVFDSKEKALQYTSRFKTNRNYDIFEQDLNPHFEADREKMPMEIEFDVNGTIYISKEIQDGQDIELAVENGYILNSNSLYCYTLAKDEIEALTNAMKIKDRASEKGDWKIDDHL